MEKTENNIVLEKVIELIKKNYEPVTDLGQATFTPSTTDLYTKMQEFYPAAYDPASMVTMLISAGYRFTEVNLDFVWLLKEL